MIVPWPTYCSTTCSKPPSYCEVPRHGSQPSSRVERHRRSSCAEVPIAVPACSLRDTASPVSTEEITVWSSRRISASPTIAPRCEPFAPLSRKGPPSSYSPGQGWVTPLRADATPRCGWTPGRLSTSCDSRHGLSRTETRYRWSKLSVRSSMETGSLPARCREQGNAGSAQRVLR